jgi:hypothetical protein
MALTDPNGANGDRPPRFLLPVRQPYEAPVCAATAGLDVFRGLA